MTEYIIVKKPKRRSRSEDTSETFNLVDILRQRKDENKVLEDFLKEQVKKEEKKEEKKHHFTFAEGIILAYAAQFIIGPIYKVMLANMGIH